MTAKPASDTRRRDLMTVPFRCRTRFSRAADCFSTGVNDRPGTLAGGDSIGEVAGEVAQLETSPGAAKASLWAGWFRGRLANRRDQQNQRSLTHSSTPAKRRLPTPSEGTTG